MDWVKASPFGSKPEALKVRIRLQGFSRVGGLKNSLLGIM